MRSWNRVGVIVVVAFAQRCRYSDFTPAKLVTEKCDKARNLVKLSARLGGPGATRQAGALRRRRSTCIQILGKYPGYPAGKERADNTFLGIELLSMSAQLQRRLSLRTCRRNTRTRKRPREIFILPFFPQKYHRHRSAENESAYFRAPRRRSEKFSSPNSSLTKKKSVLKREEMKQIVLSHGLPFSFSPSLGQLSKFARGMKSRRRKSS